MTCCLLFTTFAGTPKKATASTAERLATIREKKNPVAHPSETRVPSSTAGKLASFRERKERQAADTMQASELQHGTSNAPSGQHFASVRSIPVIEGTESAESTDLDSDGNVSAINRQLRPLRIDAMI